MTAPHAEGQSPASDHRWLILVIVAIAQLMVILDRRYDVLTGPLTWAYVPGV